MSTSTDHPIDALKRLEAAAQRFETPCEKGSMVWRRWGSGPPLVLLHGGFGSWQHWVRNIPEFARDHTVWAPDLPGLGESADYTGPVPEGLASVVAHGLEQLIPDGTLFDLAGFSFGSLISGHVAAQLGQRIRALVLCCPGALGVPRARVDLLKWTPDLPAHELQRIFRENLLRLMIARPENADEMALIIHEKSSLRARIRSRRVAMGDSLAQALHRSRPKHISAIWGELDSIAMPYMEERRAFFHALRPDAGFHQIPDAGHWVQYEAAPAFNALLRTILDTV